MKANRIVMAKVWMLGWPAILLLAVTASFWLLWPSGAYGPRPVRRMPEPGAAYVLHDPRAVLVFMKPDLFARPSHLGFGRALPDRLPDYPFEPYLLSPPRYLEAARTLEPEPLGVALPPLAGREDVSRYARIRPPSEGAAHPPRTGWVLSPSLERAGLSIDPPESLATNGIWRLRLYLVPSGESEPGGLRIFSEAEGLEDRAVRAWHRWAQEAFTERDPPRGFVDLFPAQRGPFGP